MHSHDIIIPRCLAAVLIGAFLSSPAVHAGGEAFIVHPDGEDLVWAECPDFFPEGCGMAVLQGDPADHNADILLRIPGQSTIPHHWHSSAERMVLVAGEFHVHYDGQEPVVMRQGTYAYGPPRLPHVAHCRSDEDCLLFIAFEKPVDAIPGAPE
ncbi:MAG: cupin domain-containing protein [Gammaproteobacteria bacterium]|nr:MAG: cupin domain-containing protein [Gammaproteobacteria bacterium]